MSTPPEASIIVPSYRGAGRLPALFDALAGQQIGGPDFEVIVVIDGVDDGSVALVEAESRFPVSPVLFPENRGRVEALNAGFGTARGRVLIRCDDDLVPGDCLGDLGPPLDDGKLLGVDGLRQRRRSLRAQGGRPLDVGRELRGRRLDGRTPGQRPLDPAQARAQAMPVDQHGLVNEFGKGAEVPGRRWRGGLRR